jgi:hypothetical protein
MPVNTGAAYGIYAHDVALPTIVNTLNRAGFENEDICLVLSATHPIASVVRHANIFNDDRDHGAASARMIGWFSEFGAVVIPTVGFFIRSQAYLHALVTEQNSSGYCGRTGTLAGLGFSADDADKLDEKLCDLGAMVYISCDEGAKAEWAMELLRHTGAQDAARLQSAQAFMAAA